MKYLVFCFLFYVINTRRIVDPKIVLAEIDDNRMGRTFLNAIQIGLSSGSPIHEIQNRFMIESEQKDADQYISSTQASCQRLLHDFQKNYAYHSSQYKVHEKIVEDNNGNLQRSLNKIAEISVEIEENAQKQADGQSERDAQYGEFQEKMKDHNEAISAIDEAYALIEHLQGGASFIQVKSRFNKVLSRLENQPRGSALLFQPILQLMSQLASKSDQDAAKKVLSLLANLRVQIVESKSQDESIENQQAANWQKFLADLVNERNTLQRLIQFSNISRQDQRQNLEQSILNYQSIIEESESKVEYHQTEYERNKENVEMQDQWCRQQQEIYDMESQKRVAALELISQIVDHIQDKIVTLKEYLKERIQS